jgi:threonyl-tRNA synthetase
VIAARINGELRDLSAPLAGGDAVEPVEVGSDDGRAIMRHSTAHVMAQAVQGLFPEAKLGIGPPVETASTTTSTWRPRSAPRTSRPSSSGCARS